MKKKFHHLNCLCIVLFLCLAFSGTVNASDIVIGMSAAFKGPSGGLGIELYRGSMAYIEHVNRKGGINGRKIVIRAYDDGYNPIPAIENTIKLIEEDNVFMLFNYVGTPTVTRVLPLLKKYSDRKVYLFSPFTGAQPQREAPYNEFVINLRPSYRDETGGLVDNFISIGRKRIAVFYQADAYGRSGWDGVKRALARHGLKIIGEATYRRGTQYQESLKRQADILKQSSPDAIISIGSYAACAALIRDARDAGMEMPVANVSFVGSENLLELLVGSSKKSGRDYTRKLINSQVVPSYEDTSLRAVREYKALIDAYNPLPPKGLLDAGYKPLKYNFVSFEGFINAKVLVEVLKRLGQSPDKKNIKKAVEGIKALDVGIDAPVTFRAGSSQGLNKVYYSIVKDGRFIPLNEWAGLKK